MKKYFKYSEAVCETYAYCLMPNHFHAMVRIRNEGEIARNFKKNITQTMEVLKTSIV